MRARTPTLPATSSRSCAAFTSDSSAARSTTSGLRHRPVRVGRPRDPAVRRAPRRPTHPRRGDRLMSTTDPRTPTAPAPGGSGDVDGDVMAAVLKARRFLTRADVSDDTRTVFKVGGREGDVFYRDRWSHDKIVRSTHGVNCTGSCSWKVYVKDGIITWESQQTDYPSRRSRLPGVRAARLPARRGLLLVHLLAHPGSLPVRPRRAARDVPRGQGAPRRPGGRVRRGRRRPPTCAAGTSGPAARAGSCARAGRRRSSSSRPRRCTPSSSTGPTGSQASRRSPRCQWRRTPPAPATRACSAARCSPSTTGTRTCPSRHRRSGATRPTCPRAPTGGTRPI